MIMAKVEPTHGHSGWPASRSLAALGISRATYHRRRKPVAVDREPPAPPVAVHAVTPEERAAVVRQIIGAFIERYTTGRLSNGTGATRRPKPVRISPTWRLDWAAPLSSTHGPVQVGRECGRSGPPLRAVLMDRALARSRSGPGEAGRRPAPG